MDDQAINHLLNALAQDKPLSSPTILNNLVYYTPRIKTVLQLSRLINAIFSGTSRSNYDVLELFEMSQAIAQWKLEISEPVITPSQFYERWDACFRACTSWTRSKLAILAGILSTRDNFQSIQASNFIDDSGKVIKYYESWREDLFIPTFINFLTNSARDPTSLILTYAVISHPSDASRHGHLPWDMITVYLSRLLLQYMAGPSQTDSFFEKNISRVAKTMQTSLANSSEFVIQGFLSQLCRVCYDLSFSELRDQQHHKDYSTRYYSNILFTVVVVLDSILQTPASTSLPLFSQVVMILFNLNFIAEDVGLAGFDSYESVYEVTCTGIVLTAKQEVYISTLKVMNGNVLPDVSHPNRVNRAKLLFMLKFMGSTLSEVSPIPVHFIKDFIQPLQMVYMRSPEKDIRESTHIMTLSLFSNKLGGDEFLQWEAQNCLPYMDLSTQQFLLDEISEKQLIMIYQKMSSRLPNLQLVNRHLSRETLHYIYLKILNCHLQQTAKRAVLLKCMIYQLLYSSEDFLVDWLDATQELLSSIEFTKEQRNDIVTTLWDVLSHSKSDKAFKWWYGQLDSLRSRL